MTKRLETRAVVVAGGRSLRFGAPQPKQFHLLGGRPVLFYGADAIARLDSLKEIVFVFPQGDLHPAIEAELAQFSQKHTAIEVRRAPGGVRRQDSVASGLRAFSRPCDVALVHDAARPFPPVDAMRVLVDRAWELGGAILAVRATDTVKQAGKVDEPLIEATLDRSRIWLAQTPQAFRGEFIDRACALMSEPVEFTDESAVLEKLGIAVGLVEGSPENLKITRQRDLLMAELLLNRMQSIEPA